MDIQLNSEPIKQLLNRSLEQLDPSTLAQIYAARMRALERHEASATATLPSLAWAGTQLIQRVSAHRQEIYNWIGILLLAACIFNGIVYYWQETMNDMASETDIAILTDDLPVEYFLK